MIAIILGAPLLTAFLLLGAPLALHMYERRAMLRATRKGSK